MLTLARVRRRFPEAQEFPGGHGGIEYYCHCPKNHRKGPHNYKLSINADTGVFVCHDCGWSGSAYDEWFDGVDEFFAHLSVQPAAPLPALSKRPTQVLDEWMDGVPGPGRVRLLSELPSNHVAFVYLRDDRGFEEEELRAFMPERALYYCEEGAFTRGGGTNGGRIVFPIYMYGELKGWQARQIEQKFYCDDGIAPSHKLVWNGKTWLRYDFSHRAGKFADEAKGIPKYNTCSGMQRSQCLYGFDSARQFQSVVEVEGPLDALAVGPEAVATMGGNGSLSLGQAKLICACWQSVVRVLDPKVDTQSRGFLRAMESLRAIPATWLKLPDGRDAGATARDVIWQSIADALTASPTTA